jgi:hypothetical protein
MFDGVLKECLVTTAKDGEIVCIAKDRSFVKFPKGTKFDTAVKKHNEANKTKPLAPDEIADKQADELAAWLDEE